MHQVACVASIYDGPQKDVGGGYLLDDRGQKRFTSTGVYRGEAVGQMTTPNRQQFVLGVAILQLGLLLVLYLFDHLDPALYFVLSYIGFLTLVDVTSPPFVRPRWRKRLVPIVGLGVLVFGYIVSHQILDFVGTL